MFSRCWKARSCKVQFDQPVDSVDKPLELGLGFGTFLQQPAPSNMPQPAVGDVAGGGTRGPTPTPSRPATNKRTSSGRPSPASTSSPQQPAPGAPPPHGGLRSSKPGKKARDLAAAAENLLEDFETAIESSGCYFGPGWRTHGRYCKRLFDDLSARVMTPSDADESEKLTKLKKQLSALIAICRYVLASGISSKGFGECYDTQAQFLNMQPHCELRFPMYPKTRRYEAKAQAACTPQAFWNLMDEAKMTEVGFSPEAAMQRAKENITQRVLETLSTSLADATSSLKSYFPLDGLDTFAWESRLPSCSSQIINLTLIVNHTSLPVVDLLVKNLQVAVGDSHDPATIAAAMRNYPRGRALLSEAAAWLLRAQATLDVQQGLSQSAESICMACHDRSAMAVEAAGVGVKHLAKEAERLDSCHVEHLQQVVGPAVQEAYTLFINVGFQHFVLCTKDLFYDHTLLSAWSQESRGNVTTWFALAATLQGIPGFHDEEWAPGQVHRMHALLRCQDIIKVLGDMPELLDKSAQLTYESAADLQRSVNSSLQLTDALANNLGPDAVEKFEAFKAAVPALNDGRLRAKMLEALGPRATETLKKLIESMGTDDKIFEVTLIGEKASLEEALQQLEQWKLEHEYVTEVVEFAMELGDDILRNEVTFIAALSKLLPCAVAAGRFARCLGCLALRSCRCNVAFLWYVACSMHSLLSAACCRRCPCPITKDSADATKELRAQMQAQMFVAVTEHWNTCLPSPMNCHRSC